MPSNCLALLVRVEYTTEGNLHLAWTKLLRAGFPVELTGLGGWT